MFPIKEIKDILIVGDLHLNSSTPISRIDDYADTSIEKLNNLLSLCMDKSISVVILLGDVFHKPQQPLSYLYRVIEAFNKFKDNGIDVYSIVGNSHDVPYDKVAYLPKTSLGLLFKTGALIKLERESFITKEGYIITFFGYDYEQHIESIENIKDLSSRVNVCVCHRFYEYSFSSSSLTESMIKSLGYNIYCCGHEHQPHDLVNVDGRFIVRPGRFMRGTSDNYNIENTSVFVDILRFNGSLEDPRITVIREILPTKSASEVFNTKALSKDKSNKTLAELSSQVDILLDKMDIKGTSNTSVYALLDNLEVDKRIKLRIETYLQSVGIFREELKI